jgi:hypothetical protein
MKKEIKQFKRHIEILKARHGNYTQVAMVLGKTPRHFRKIRNGQSRPDKTIIRLAAALAEQTK